jgi:cytochrome c biogenesis factor
MLILPSAVLSSYLLRHYEGEQARVILVLTITAALLSFLPPLVPGKVMQRFVQVHSPYFFSTLAMFAASAVALISGRR